MLEKVSWSMKFTSLRDYFAMDIMFLLSRIPYLLVTMFSGHSAIYFQPVIAVKGYRVDCLSVRAISVFRCKCFSLGMWLAACVSMWQLVSGCSLTAEGLLLMLHANPTQSQHIFLYNMGTEDTREGVNRESKDITDVHIHTQEVSHTCCEDPVHR